MLNQLKNKAKKISKDIILINICIVALGLFLVIRPGDAREILCRIIGGIIALWGGFKLFQYFIVKRKTAENINILPLIGGCVLLAIGVSVLIAPHFLEGLFTAALALILFLGAVFKLQYAVAFVQNNSKMWWIQTIGAILMVITSVLAFINPFGQSGNLIFVFIGISLIADGIWDLISLFFISKILKNAVSQAESTREYYSDPSTGKKYLVINDEDIKEDDN